MKKKLIEVALPLEAINKASAREKSIRHGHPSTLHLWWARRPLAACRAVLFAQLVDDPSCYPEQFPTEEALEAERQRLFAIIEELVIWENSTNDEVLERARVEIRRSCDGELPPIYDPFSGGCSIPLEAQRLGLPAHGSDLNPVAVTIGKAMIEIPPRFRDQVPVHPGPRQNTDYRHATGLAEDVKHYGEWMRERAWDRIGHLYPTVTLPQEQGGGEATVIAWIWARTVPSPDPALNGLHVPLVRSFDLSTKKGKRAWVEPIIEGRSYRFEVRTESEGHVRHGLEGTVGRQGGICLVSRTAMPLKYIREQGKKGHLSQRLMAVVAEGKGGRLYIEPNQEQETLADTAKPNYRPEALLPKNPRDFKTPNYGMNTFGDLFTDRQLVALNTFSDLVAEAREQIEQDALAAGLSDDQTPLRDGGTGAKAYAEGVSVYLGFAVDRTADSGSTIATWATGGFIRFTFARQAIPMTWDFAECNPMSSSTGNFRGAIDWVYKAIEGFVPAASGEVTQQAAQHAIVPKNAVVSTDPPYYDNIGYADLSDYFYAWMKRNIQPVFPSLSGTIAVPKNEELVATPYRHGGKREAETFFLNGMGEAMQNLADATHENQITTVYYAFKQSEIDESGLSSTGWATFLQALLTAGFSIVGTWPVRTERAARTIASGTNALANSVVLVCRKRSIEAELTTRSDFVRQLKRELPAAIEKLQAAHIAPADMPQSAIGPGMGIFSRYRSVLENDDSPMSVKTALQLINRELDEYLSDLQGELDDETRFAVEWYKQHGYDKGEYGAANSLAQARGIAVEAVAHAGIVIAEAGKVALIPRAELDDDWSPDTDEHITLWECCQYLIRSLENDGESAAAELLSRMQAAQQNEIKDLAYCLYDIAANKRAEAKEGTSYNSLIAVWSELLQLAQDMDGLPSAEQGKLEL